jgi:uncharacterized protein
VRARRRGRADAADLGRDYAALLAPLLAISEATLRAGLTVFESGRLGAFDAVLAAAAMAIDTSALVSADQVFSTVPGLTHVVPDAEGVAAILRGR